MGQYEKALPFYQNALAYNFTWSIKFENNETSFFSESWFKFSRMVQIMSTSSMKMMHGALELTIFFKIC